MLERSGNKYPFLLPAWLTTWWDAFHQDRPLIRDSLCVKVVRRGSTVVGILPFMRTERPGVGPFRARALGCLGADEYVTEQRTPIYDPGCQGEVAQAIADELRADGGWDWIWWDGLDRNAEFTRVLDVALRMHWGHSDTANVLRLRPSWDEFRGGLRHNVKESLRKCYNSLKRDGFTPRLVVAETASDVEKALDTFFALHTARARMTDAVHHPDRFAGSHPRRFLVEVCRALAEQHITRVFTLEVEGKSVASRIGFWLPGCLYLYYSGYDPAWGKYSVMTTTVAEIIQYAIERGVPAIHLSMGLDVSKTRWGGDTQVLYEAVCVRPRWTSQAALQLYSWGRDNPDLKRAIGRLLPKRRFD